MAKESIKARQIKREKLVAKFAAKRAAFQAICGRLRCMGFSWECLHRRNGKAVHEQRARTRNSPLFRREFS